MSMEQWLDNIQLLTMNFRVSAVWVNRNRTWNLPSKVSQIFGTRFRYFSKLHVDQWWFSRLGHFFLASLAMVNVKKGHGRMTPEVAKIYGIDMDSVTSIRSTTDDIFHMSICPYHFHINHIISYSLVNIHKKPIENHHAVNG
jgi:hypothetical protein